MSAESFRLSENCVSGLWHGSNRQRQLASLNLDVWWDEPAYKAVG